MFDFKKQNKQTSNNNNKNTSLGTSLVVQWLRHCASTARSRGFDPWLVRELRSPMPRDEAKKKKRERYKLWKPEAGCIEIKGLYLQLRTLAIRTPGESLAYNSIPKLLELQTSQGALPPLDPCWGLACRASQGCGAEKSVTQEGPGPTAGN